jgi:hypothetical protein
MIFYHIQILIGAKMLYFKVEGYVFAGLREL